MAHSFFSGKQLKDGHMARIVFSVMLGMIALALGYMFDSIAIVTVSHLMFIVLYYLLLFVSKKNILAQPLYLVPLIATVYAVTWPLVKHVLNLTPEISFSNYDTELTATLYYCVFIQFFCLLTGLYQKDEQDAEDAVLSWCCRTKRNVLVELMMWGFTLLVVFIYFNAGGLTLESNGANRELVNSRLAEIPYYAFLTYMFSAATVYLLIAFFQTQSVEQKMRFVPGLLSSAVFYFTQLQIGNRRELLYVGLGIALYCGLRYGRKIKLRWILIAMAAVVSMLVVSVVRTHGSLSNVPNLSFMVYTLVGEFINPTVTLYYYMEADISFAFGSTLLLFIPLLVPRFLWPGKPNSLAVTFVEECNLAIGYGFSPATEGYINFGYAGCILYTLILYVLMSYVSRNSRKHPYLFLALYLQLINIFRGEFSSSMIEIIIFAVTFWGIGKINSENTKGDSETEFQKN